MISRITSLSAGGGTVSLTSADGSITVNSQDLAIAWSVISVSGTTTIALTDSILYVNTSSARTINLPAPSTRLRVYIKDATGQAATNNITLVRPGAQSIEGVAQNRVLQTNFGSWYLTSDGTNYFLE